jgi:hypothetical protein
LFRRDDIAGQSEAPDELAGTFHVWQDLDFITGDRRGRKKRRLV